MNVPIVIIGSGIAGMLTSLGLSKFGIKSTILERKTKDQIEKFDDPRTTALNDSSISYLKSINIWENIEEFTQQINDIFVCQNMKDQMLHMKGDEFPLGVMIENSLFRKFLFDQVLIDNNINLILGENYDQLNPSDRNVEIHISNGQKITANLCIAADGKFSEAKNIFFNEKYKRDYNQKALVFNISHENDHEGGAIEHFLPRGPFATLPLKAKKTSSIVWTENSDYVDYLSLLTNDVLEKQIEKLSGNSLGKVKIITKPESFPLNAHICDKYYNGMLALIADSAHSVHPLAGQGLNIGIKDVKSMVDLVKEYSNLGMIYDIPMLNKYQSMRKFDNLNMFRITDTINSLFSSKSKTINFLTQSGLGFINEFSAIKSLLVNYAKGSR